MGKGGDKIFSQKRGNTGKGGERNVSIKTFTSQAKVAKQDKSYSLILLNQNTYLFLEGIQKYYFMNLSIYSST